MGNHPTLKVEMASLQKMPSLGPGPTGIRIRIGKPVNKSLKGPLTWIWISVLTEHQDPTALWIEIQTQELKYFGSGYIMNPDPDRQAG